MIRPRALVTLGAAVVLAAISVVLARAWLSEAARQAARPVAPAVETLQTRPLVVTARALSYGDRVGPDDVKLVPWPESSVPAQALHDLAWLEGGGVQGLGPLVLRPMAANEPVLTSKISGFGAPSRLAATITPGLRATTIRAQGAPDMAALIGAGDRVDVLIAREVSRDGQERELRSDVLLRDLRVLGLDERASSPVTGTGRARAVTLEVTVEQAQILAVAEKVGVLSLALRGMASRDTAESRPVSSHARCA